MTSVTISIVASGDINVSKDIVTFDYTNALIDASVVTYLLNIIKMGIEGGVNFSMLMRIVAQMGVTIT